LVLSVSTLATYGVGYGSYLYVNGHGYSDDFTLSTQNKPAVCYIGTTKYTSIEKALSIASSNTTADTVFVIPGTNPTITRTCSLASQDTLCIPYENEVWQDPNRGDATNTAKLDFFADDSAAHVATFRKNVVTISSGISLTINGTLQVGGVLGRSASGSYQRPTGQTAGNYSQITLCSNASIVNKGNIYCYGYIKEDSINNGSFVNNVSGSNIYLPFVIYDYKGGKFTYNMNSNSVFPLSIFDFCNCQVTTKYNYGAKLLAVATLTANSSVYCPDPIPIIGTDTGLFRLNSGYISMNYTSASYPYTTNDAIAAPASVNKTNLDIYGNLDFVSTIISLDTGIFLIGSVTMDSSQVFCPLSYKFKIVAHSGTVNIANKVKFLPGSSLTIEEGATVNINANTIFYEDYKFKTFVAATYPTNQGAASLINNGTLVINSSFGGFIDVTSSQAATNTAGSFVSGCSSPEPSTYDSSSLGSLTTESVTVKSSGYIDSGTVKPANTSEFEASKSYVSKGDWWASKTGDITSVSFTPGSGESGKNTQGSFTLKASVSPSENTSTNVSYAWSSTGGTLSATSGETVTFTTPANSSTESNVSYTVTCTATFTNSKGEVKTVTNSGIFTATKADAESCLAKGTKILMANHTYKNIEDLSIGEEICVFNHDRGEIDKSIAAYVFKNENIRENILELSFDNGVKMNVIMGHCFFNKEECKYIELRENNAKNYIGKHFYYYDDLKKIGYYVKLNKVTLGRVVTSAYSIASAYHMNCIAEGFVNITDDIAGLYNYFDCDDNLKYYPLKKAEDIKKYGLFTYEERKNVLTPEQFELFNVKYLKVSIGKGLLTKETMLKYIHLFF
jgi:predicted RecA/RadA family phage recombinase